MGLLSWLIEEVVEAFSDDPPSTGGAVDLVSGGTFSTGLDFVDPLAVGGGNLGFEDPLSEGQRIIDRDPVLSGVQETMSETAAQYREVMGTSHIPTGSESIQELVSNVGSASPDQLERMSTQLEGMNAAEGIRNSVAESQAALSDSNAQHQAIIDANKVEIDAQVQNSEAASLIAKTNSDLGTAY